MNSPIKVTIESRHCAFVRGHGTRELLTELRGRPPVWSVTARAWVTTETTAADLIAVAERRGRAVEVESYVVVPVVQRVEHGDPGGGRW